MDEICEREKRYQNQFDQSFRYDEKCEQCEQCKTNKKEKRFCLRTIFLNYRSGSHQYYFCSPECMNIYENTKVCKLCHCRNNLKNVEGVDICVVQKQELILRVMKNMLESIFANIVIKKLMFMMKNVMFWMVLKNIFMFVKNV